MAAADDFQLLNMPSDLLQRQRFELKYQLPPRYVPALREFVRCHLEPDPFSSVQPDATYPVRSIYLDSPDLRLCQATVNGERNRFKLRIRYYTDQPESPVFFEVKSRRNEYIFKKRATVRRACVPALLAGESAVRDHLIKNELQQLESLRFFLAAARSLDASPRAYVGYRREAWMSHNHNAVRVTFDSAVVCEPCTQADFGDNHRKATEVFSDIVILEVKFTDRFPAWIGEMVRSFNLVRGGAAKYVDGLAAAEAHGMPTKRQELLTQALAG